MAVAVQYCYGCKHHNIRTSDGGICLYFMIWIIILQVEHYNSVLHSFVEFAINFDMISIVFEYFQTMGLEQIKSFHFNRTFLIMTSNSHFKIRVKYSTMVLGTNWGAPFLRPIFPIFILGQIWNLLCPKIYILLCFVALAWWNFKI